MRGPAAAPKTRAFEAARALAPRWGTELSFYGWSPDGRFLAYKRVRRLPGEGGKRPKTESRAMHRAVDRGRLEGFGPGFGKSLADYARQEAYRADALTAERLDERTWRFAAPEGEYRLELWLGASLGWRLSLDGELLAEQPFDTLYVAFEPALYPAPDRSAVALVLMLDTGWLVDAAIFTAALPAAARARWKAAAVAPPGP